MAGVGGGGTDWRTTGPCGSFPLVRELVAAYGFGGKAIIPRLQMALEAARLPKLPPR